MGFFSRIFSRQAEAEPAAPIVKLIHGLDGFDDKEKNAIARAVIQECTWDGERLFIKL